MTVRSAHGQAVVPGQWVNDCGAGNPVVDQQIDELVEQYLEIAVPGKFSVLVDNPVVSQAHRCQLRLTGDRDPDVSEPRRRLEVDGHDRLAVVGLDRASVPAHLKPCPSLVASRDRSGNASSGNVTPALSHAAPSRLPTSATARRCTSGEAIAGKAVSRLRNRLPVVLLEGLNQRAFEKRRQVPERHLLGTVLRPADSTFVLGTMQPFKENQGLVSTQLDNHTVATNTIRRASPIGPAFLNCLRHCAPSLPPPVTVGDQPSAPPMS
jgi:hypothetical protein